MHEDHLKKNNNSYLKSARDFLVGLDRLPRGATTLSDLSTHIDEAMEQAWMYASLLYGRGQIRTGDLLVAMVKSRSLAAELVGMSAEFRKVKGEELTDSFSEVVGGSPEDSLTSRDGVSVVGGAEPGEASGRFFISFGVPF